MSDREVTVEKTKTSQAKPMTTWCLLVVVLVMTFIAIGVALFFTPGHGQPLQKNAAPVVLTK
jgi:flagellar basal body-associated protein FliL